MSGFERICRRDDTRCRRKLRDEAGEHHASTHRGDEDECGGRAKSERGQGRAWTKAYKAPADTENGGTGDNSRIDIFSRWDIEGTAEEGPRQFQDAAEADEGHRDRASHHESEACIPR